MDLDRNCYVMPDGECRSPWTCVHGHGVPWVEIDLNARSEAGFVRAPTYRTSRVLYPDEWVWVFNPDDRVMAPAQVIDAGLRFVHLVVHWDMMVDDPYGFTMPNGWTDVNKIWADLPIRPDPDAADDL